MFLHANLAVDEWLLFVKRHVRLEGLTTAFCVVAYELIYRIFDIRNCRISDPNDAPDNGRKRCQIVGLWDLSALRCKGQLNPKVLQDIFYL